MKTPTVLRAARWCCRTAGSTRNDYQHPQPARASTKRKQRTSPWDSLTVSSMEVPLPEFRISTPKIRMAVAAPISLVPQRVTSKGQDLIGIPRGQLLALREDTSEIGRLSS